MFTVKQYAKQLLSSSMVSKQIIKKQIPAAVINHRDDIPDYDLDVNPVKIKPKFTVWRVLNRKNKSGNILNGN